MKDKKDNELKRLQELVRKIDGILHSFDSNHRNIDHKVSWYSNPVLRDRLFKKNPDCFTSIGHNGRRPAFLPICNKHAIKDPEVIELSIKIIDYLNKIGKCDDETKEITISRLKRLRTRLSKSVPEPYKYSSKKAKLTKYMNNLSKELSKIKDKNT